jgi:mono/diheme cytochrome c family protein
MRRIDSVGAVVKSLAFLLIVGLTIYGARLALGENEPQNSSSPPNLPSLAVYEEDGAEIYMTRCMSCHQMNGRGVPGVFPSLDGVEWVTGDKGRLIRIVMNGLTGEITVGDETYSGAMPPWNSFLDDEQMAGLLTYLRSTWSNDASEVTSAEVASVRAATEDRRDPWTEAELLEEANTGIPGSEDAEADPDLEDTDAEVEQPDTSGQK